MGRKCLICTNKQRKEIDREIVGGTPLRTIAGRFTVTKSSLLRHRRRHVPDGLKTKQQMNLSEMEEMLRRADLLIKRFDIHMKTKPNSALSLDWIRESRDVRGWFTFRSKHIGKVAPANEGQTRTGDVFNMQFVGPDRQPVKIPLSVYRSLPTSVFNGEKAENSDAVLQESHKIPEVRDASDRGNGSFGPTSMQ